MDIPHSGVSWKNLSVLGLVAIFTDPRSKLCPAFMMITYLLHDFTSKQMRVLPNNKITKTKYGDIIKKFNPLSYIQGYIAILISNGKRIYICRVAHLNH